MNSDWPQVESIYFLRLLQSFNLTFAKVIDYVPKGDIQIKDLYALCAFTNTFTVSVLATY